MKILRCAILSIIILLTGSLVNAQTNPLVISSQDSSLQSTLVPVVSEPSQQQQPVDKEQEETPWSCFVVKSLDIEARKNLCMNYLDLLGGPFSKSELPILEMPQELVDYINEQARKAGIFIRIDSYGSLPNSYFELPEKYKKIIKIYGILYHAIIPSFAEGYRIWELDKDSYVNFSLAFDVMMQSIHLFCSQDYALPIITDYDVKCGKHPKIPRQIWDAPILGIWLNAFAQKGLASITLPYGVKFIQDWAFIGNNLKSLRLPASLIYVWTGIFENNPLEYVDLWEMRLLRSFLDLGNFQDMFLSSLFGELLTDISDSIDMFDAE